MIYLRKKRKLSHLIGCIVSYTSDDFGKLLRYLIKDRPLTGLELFTAVYCILYTVHMYLKTVNYSWLVKILL
jgi:hypothetical protein